MHPFARKTTRGDYDGDVARDRVVCGYVSRHDPRGNLRLRARPAGPQAQTGMRPCLARYEDSVFLGKRLSAAGQSLLVDIDKRLFLAREDRFYCLVQSGC
jgi:hypothetical protein